MRKEPDIFSAIKLYKRVYKPLCDKYIVPGVSLTRRSLAAMARSIAESIMTAPEEVEILAIYNYLLDTMLGDVTPDVFGRNLKRIVANKHILSLDPHALCTLDDGVTNIITCGMFGGIQDQSVDLINPNRTQLITVPFSCITGPLAGLDLRVSLRPGMSLVYGCGLPKRDKYVVWSYFTRCFARVRLEKAADKGNLDYMLREVNATTAMQKYNKAVLRLRSDIHNGPPCLRRYQCCTLCNNTECSLSLRQAKKGEADG